MAEIRLHLREADGDLPAVGMRCGGCATITKTKNIQLADEEESRPRRRPPSETIEE